ncbi:hypothetical protein GCM10023238_35260 [Streptomyces heliomycini]
MWVGEDYGAGGEKREGGERRGRMENGEKVDKTESAGGRREFRAGIRKGRGMVADLAEGETIYG